MKAEENSGYKLQGTDRAEHAASHVPLTTAIPDPQS